MALKTQGVLDLVRDALATMPSPPYGEDITLEVSRCIRDTPDLCQRYTQLKSTLTEFVTNQAIGTHTKRLVGMTTIHQVDATDKDIIGSYSKLKY